MIQIIFNSIQIVEYGVLKTLTGLGEVKKKKNINFEQ